MANSNKTEPKKPTNPAGLGNPAATEPVGEPLPSPDVTAELDDLRQKVKELETQLVIDQETRESAQKAISTLRGELEEANAKLEEYEALDARAGVKPAGLELNLIEQSLENVVFQDAPVDYIGDGVAVSPDGYVYTGVVGFDGDDTYRYDSIISRATGIVNRALNPKHFGGLAGDEPAFTGFPSWDAKTTRLRVIVAIERK